MKDRCFIIASGPSIEEQDLSWLKDEVTIGVNTSYQITRKFGFDPTYRTTGGSFARRKAQLEN